jgi:hypothetical protein
MASPLAMSGMRPQRRSAARAGAYAQAHEGGDEDGLQLSEEEEEEEEEEAAPRQRGRRAGKGKLLATVLLLLRGGARTRGHARSGLSCRRHSWRLARPFRALHFAAAPAAAAPLAASVQLL